MDSTNTTLAAGSWATERGHYSRPALVVRTTATRALCAVPMRTRDEAPLRWYALADLRPTWVPTGTTRGRHAKGGTFVANAWAALRWAAKGPGSDVGHEARRWGARFDRLSPADLAAVRALVAAADAKRAARQAPAPAAEPMAYCGVCGRRPQLCAHDAPQCDARLRQVPASLHDQPGQAW